MDLNTLTAISPIDGRYRAQIAQLATYFSEFGLMKYRVKVEIAYFLFLSEKGFFRLDAGVREHVLRIAEHFKEAHALRIKQFEKTTNHDVKAVEYFIKEELSALGLDAQKEWVHFALTSQDINNTAIPMLWKDALAIEFLPLLEKIAALIAQKAREWQNVPLLAHTHGQPASPTAMGKEWMVFAERINGQIRLLQQIPNSAKFGGATGNFNAHMAAFPNTDWAAFADEFTTTQLGLVRTKFTTQIEPYDNLAASFDSLKRINTILTDFCRDIWQYIAMEYFKQRTKEGEVGSSAMPHKVNPIDFENAEGNLGIANALYEHFSAKLPVSRLQRDLTDSTVLRNVGVPLSHSYIALRSIEKGIGKLVLNTAKIHADLEHNWAVVAEAIQTVLRREQYPQPYEALKALTRGQEITAATIEQFINTLEVSESVRAELRSFAPHNYTGTAMHPF
jgi:adenylosuccinate lyase